MGFRGYSFSDLENDLKIVNQSGFEFNSCIKGASNNKSIYRPSKCILKKCYKRIVKKK